MPSRIRRAPRLAPAPRIPRPGPRGLAARAGHWSARHRRIAILGWLAFVVAAVFAGGALGTRHLDQADQGTGESGRAARTLRTAFPQPASEQVLVRSSRLTAADPAFRAAVRDVQARLERTGQVTGLRSPLVRAHAGQISRDRHAALLTFGIRGDPATAKDRVGATLAATAAAQRARPGIRIGQFGEASAERAFEGSLEADFSKAQRLSLPITLAILIFAFGALLAAGIPVLLALTAVAATLGLLAIPSQIAPVDLTIAEVVLLIGMAVGVDYSLFFMRRVREERAAGRDPDAALDVAAATSGRSVLVSGLTVMAAMAGLYFTGDRTFSSFATGTILVVAVAVAGSLTVLPALLSALGDRVMAGRVPFLARRREAARGESRLWNAVLGRVLRRPLAATVAAGGLLVALAVPVLGLHTAQPGADGLPQDLPGTKVLHAIERSFPGGPLPAQVVVSAPDVRAPAVRAGIRRLRAAALATGQMHEPIAVRESRAGTTAVVSVPLSGSGTDAASERALARLRGDVIPRTLGALPGTRAAVGGMTADSADYNAAMTATAPLVFLFVLAMSFVLLLLTFRSIVIPLVAIALNLLSVGAAYGVLVLVFQHGWGESLLGFHATGAVTAWLPAFLFVILFGLSMDYHVFIVSRIREARAGGMATRDAIAQGIRSTAGAVTSAAAVMVAVFAIFGSLGALVFKQMGVGLAAAVLIDATLVRAVLLPAVMTLLGERNWWLPRRLAWLPRAGTEAAPGREPAPARA